MKKSVLTSLIAASALFTGVAFAGNYGADANYTAADTSAMAGSESSLGQGWYVGVGVNRSATNSISLTTKNADGEQTNNASATSTKYGYDVLAGKKFTDMFAVEASYNTYGKNTFGVTGTEDNATYDPLWSTMLMGVVSTPAYEGFTAHAKGGLAYYSVTGTQTGAASSTNDSQYRGTNLAYGLGVEYDYRQFGLSFDWTRIDASQNNAGDDVYVPDQYSLNFIYNI